MNTNKEKYSPAVEDYAKQLYLLGESGSDVTGKALAERLGVAPASVTGMIKRLGELGLVERTPYQPLRLTDRGKAIALEVVRHHRLLETFLTRALGMSWEDIHDEAEVLEHHISEHLESLIAEWLGHPEFDPHGHPIPAPDGQLPELGGSVSLASVPASTPMRVRCVRDERADVLRFLGTHGIVPGAAVTVTAHEQAAGIVEVEVQATGERTMIGLPLADAIDVEPSGGRP